MKNIVENGYIGHKYYLIEETDNDFILWIENEYDGYSDEAARGSFDKCHNIARDMTFEYQEAHMW